MQRHRLFAAGVSVALLLGAATPALAKPGKSQGDAHKNVKAAKAAKPAKAPKAPKSKARVNGGGTTASGVEFSVQARASKLRQAHFNYTKVGFKVRCKGFDSYAPAGTSVTVADFDCVATDAAGVRTKVRLDATFVDNGKPADDDDDAAAVPAVPVVKDQANIKFTDAAGVVILEENGDLASGNINVR